MLQDAIRLPARAEAKPVLLSYQLDAEFKIQDAKDAKKAK
jgi:hypothetical protein